MATKNACKPDRLAIERIAAMSFVALGGIFWAVTAFVGPFSFGNVGLGLSVVNALIPLAITIAAFALGWFYERYAAYALGAGALAVVAWGLFAAWEAGVWMIMLTTMALPMVIAAVLFYLAANMAEACSTEASSETPHGAVTA